MRSKDDARLARRARHQARLQRMNRQNRMMLRWCAWLLSSVSALAFLASAWWLVGGQWLGLPHLPIGWTGIPVAACASLAMVCRPFGQEPEPPR